MIDPFATLGLNPDDWREVGPDLHVSRQGVFLHRGHVLTPTWNGSALQLRYSPRGLGPVQSNAAALVLSAWHRCPVQGEVPGYRGSRRNLSIHNLFWKTRARTREKGHETTSK